MSLEYYILLILSLHFYPIICLVGDVDSICHSLVWSKWFVETYRLEPTCCRGYILVGERCEPLCAPGCDNGNCSKPNGCDCFENYFGDLCHIKKCKPGYTGKHCHRVCPKNTYGIDCESKCTCENGYCNPANGSCHCNDGWGGHNCNIKCAAEFSTCDEPCEDTLWGPDCRNKCECGDDPCDDVNGKCISSCEVGFYGKKCNKVCQCEKIATEMCSRDTGKCLCKPGYIGDKCGRLEACPLMEFGAYCSNTCVCVHTESCDRITRKCKCTSGWFGETCSEHCRCENGNCDELGACKCHLGWEGEFCNTTCSSGYYGLDCNQMCSLPDPRFYECNHKDGPICKPGFGGDSCTIACPEGMYGSGCLPCSCHPATTKSCNRYTGQCECLPGWHGTNCEKQCPSGFYGENCKSLCVCQNCRNSDGFCRCQVGWQGTTCQGYCPISNYNLVTNECFERNLLKDVEMKSAKSTRDYKYMYLLVLTVCGIVLIIVAFIVIVFCVRSRREKHTATQFTRRTADGLEAESQPCTHVYEEIAFQYNTSEYNQLHVEDEPSYLTPIVNREPQDSEISLLTFPNKRYSSYARNNDLLHLLSETSQFLMDMEIRSSAAAPDEKGLGVFARDNDETPRNLCYT